MPPVDITAIQALAEKVLGGLGYDLVDLEWKHEAGHWVLRTFIDRIGDVSSPPGAAISHVDCSRASHSLSAELDVAELIHVPYHLEVSSPGLNRPLKRETDFRRFAGQRARVRARHGLPTGKPGAEPRRNFSGQLLGVAGDKLRIEVAGEVFEIPVDDVEKANLEVDI